MGKLHELLAVESDLKARAQHALAYARSLFTEGQGKLLGQRRVYRSLTEDGTRKPDEITELATTVPAELARLQSPVAAYIDAVLSKEQTNTEAVASIELDGLELGVDELPATALLNLEARLAEVRAVINALPVNDASETWNYDAGQGHFVSRERETLSTQKVIKSVVLYEATKEHPAQVQAYNEDVPVGEWTTTLHSGMIAPTRKQTLLDRVDALARAVKQARQRANEQEVQSVRVGATLFNFILAE